MKRSTTEKNLERASFSGQYKKRALDKLSDYKEHVARLVLLRGGTYLSVVSVELPVHLGLLENTPTISYMHLLNTSWLAVLVWSEVRLRRDWRFVDWQVPRILFILHGLPYINLVASQRKPFHI